MIIIYRSLSVMDDCAEHEMLLKDKAWILLEIKLLKEELKHQREDLKDVLKNLGKYPSLSIAYKK